MTDETESKLNGSRERLVVQLEEQISTRTNIIIAANSFLFMPFVSLITGSTPLTGYLVWIPIILCMVGIVLNIFWVYSTFNQIHKRDYLITRSNLVAYFQIPPDKNAANKSNESSFYDTFNKAAPFLMIIAWIFILGFYILQKSAGIF